jgi:xylulose-5-phosphate/fructose-6-phosphate phosphoketolase
VINVVNLMKLQPPSEHPHGLSDHDFDALFTPDKPVIFAFDVYPWLIHRLTYRRTGHDNIHVRGYKEVGTTTTPFDMCVLNDLDRFHLVGYVIDRVPKLGARAAYAKQASATSSSTTREYISRYGDDMPEITGWRWGQEATLGAQEGLYRLLQRKSCMIRTYRDAHRLTRFCDLPPHRVSLSRRCDSRRRYRASHR